MAKFEFYVSTGFVGSERREEIEVDLEGLNSEQAEQELEDQFNIWLHENIDAGWFPVDDNE